MSTEAITHFGRTFNIDTSLTEYEYKEIFTTTNDLNTATEIRFDIINENAFTVPSDSYLLVEGQVQLANGNVIPNAADDTSKIALVKEGILYLFRQLIYSINDKQVEIIDYPGVAQNMLSYLLEDNSYDKTISLIHSGVKDNHIDADQGNNTAGFNQRRAFLQTSDPRGTFAFQLPLRRLFGFFRDYNKVIFGTTQRLTINAKGNSDDAIFRHNGAGACRVNLTKMRWVVPHIVGTDEINLALMNHIKGKNPIDMVFRGITISRLEVPADTTFTWRLASKQSPEVPRYVIIGFQTDKESNQEENPALFDHVNLTNLHVQLNEKHYPNVEYMANFTAQQYARVYTDAMNFKGKFFNVESTEREITSSPGMNMIEYKTLFPLFVIDTSKQREMVKHSLAELTIHARFSANIPPNTRCFAMTVSDRFLKLESDGNRLVLVQ